MRPTRREENKLYRLGIGDIAGVDEAGRGAWAGPLVAAAVVLPRTFTIIGIRDSKQLSPTAREHLYDKIINAACSYAVSVISRKVIDRLGVGAANRLALTRSVHKLSITPRYVLVDGFSISYGSIPSKGIVRGDTKVVSIAAASIIAKVYRDRLMVSYHRRFPRYHFDKHKGYGTIAHRKRIFTHGLCAQHRRSFEPMKSIVGK